MSDLLQHDRALILRTQGLRAFGYGFASVVLGSALADRGLTPAQVGGVFTAMLAGMALVSLAVGRYGDRLGRRAAYGGLFVVMGVAGSVFALTSWLPALFLAALTGTLSTDPNESGPITSLEQAMLSSSPARQRASLFARYNAVAYGGGSLGALLAAVPGWLRRAHVAAPADRWWLLLLPVVAAACLWCAAQLSAAVDAPKIAASASRPPRGLGRSRHNVQKLATLFAVDAFGGGLLVQSFLVFWLQRRYGVGIDVLGAVFFAAGLLQVVSVLLAGWLGTRIGLLQTMVFTHIPSNLLLIAVPLAPSAGLAITLLLARFALSQMDVPARQAYIAALVAPEERTAAAAYTNTARYVTRPEGPIAAGAIMQTSVAAPFFCAGAIKIAYDLMLYGLFRHVSLEEASSHDGHAPIGVD